MGGCSSKPQEKRKVTVVLVGLDNAGKSTVVNDLRGEAFEETAPTVGFNQQRLEGFEKHDVSLFDLGGSAGIRGYWDNYFPDAHGIILVVDSSDEARINEVAETVRMLGSKSTAKGKPLIVLANKQDVPGVLSCEQIADKIGLAQLEGHTVFSIKPCTALTKKDASVDPVLKTSVSWLLNEIDLHFATLSERVESDKAVYRAEQKLIKMERIARVKARKEAEEAEKQKNSAESASPPAAADTEHNLTDQVLASKKSAEALKSQQQPAAAEEGDSPLPNTIPTREDDTPPSNTIPLRQDDTPPSKNYQTKQPSDDTGAVSSSITPKPVSPPPPHPSIFTPLSDLATTATRLSINRHCRRANNPLATAQAA